jgi:hypothetical protein
LAACCRGKATVEEVRCKSLVSFNELAEVIIEPRTMFIVKLPIIMVMYDAYLDSDLHGEGVEEMQKHMPKLLNELLRILKGTSGVIKFLGCGLVAADSSTSSSLLESKAGSKMEKKEESDAASQAWKMQDNAQDKSAQDKDVLKFAGVGGSRGTTMQMAKFNLQQILDFVVCTVAGVGEFF